MHIFDAHLGSHHNQSKPKNQAPYLSFLARYPSCIAVRPTMSNISSVLSGLINRRSYGVYARAVNVHVSATAAVGRTADGAADGGGRATSNKDVFWMRDPKTGCWIPENRFQEVDAVELRNRLLHHNEHLTPGA
ncbi:hypothetical protein SEVIR_9G377900v4 [Setaria viridis]|uniref:Uncharacterized protein n=1 Tax=Setaria viridis TaxID=4556 RepID=A0A4U6T2B4_SETVI|nr:protein SENESCENCE-ASSOCIATED GENE 21, mitochondrial-like [Setaria viridis]TKV95670.1 hypothetical protein SEVIR_9G377900v2 [Setaria viridis]